MKKVLFVVPFVIALLVGCESGSSYVKVFQADERSTWRATLAAVRVYARPQQVSVNEVEHTIVIRNIHRNDALAYDSRDGRHDRGRHRRMWNAEINVYQKDQRPADERRDPRHQQTYVRVKYDSAGGESPDKGAIEEFMGTIERELEWYLGHGFDRPEDRAPGDEAR